MADALTHAKAPVHALGSYGQGFKSRSFEGVTYLVRADLAAEEIVFDNHCEATAL